MGLNVINNTIRLGVIGCGKMASAILGGVIKNNFLNNKNIYIYDVNKDNSSKLAQEYNFNTVNSTRELLNNVDVILLATKPFVVNEVLEDLKPNYKNQLVISILAGVKIEKYKSVIPNIKIARVMPNTPALVNKGMSAVCTNEFLTREESDFAFNFISNCGKVIKTTEDKIDIITALSGSGPAFYYKIIDLMAQSAIKLGLNEKEALLLSTQTALGSAQMILENNFDIQQLIKNVTTPGGCTEVGNNVLLNSNINEILDKTIKDTMQKAVELG